MVNTAERRNNPGLDVLLAVLPPDLSPRVTGTDVLLISPARKSVRLTPVWVGEGYPADIKRVLKELPSNASTHVVVTARRIGPSAQILLRDSGWSWADAQGFANVRVDEAGIYVTRDEPMPVRPKTIRTTGWSASAIAVAEVVLCQAIRSRSDTGQVSDAQIAKAVDLAALTQFSVGQVSRVLSDFDESGYSEKHGAQRGPSSRRVLRDPERLLSDWAAAYGNTDAALRADLHVFSRDPLVWADMAHQAMERDEYAVSGWAAADAIAPYVTLVPDAVVYVRQNTFTSILDRLATHPDITRMDDGGRIHLWSAPEYVFGFTHDVRSTSYASTIRIYADLLKAGGRGLEAAEHLRTSNIAF